MDGAEVWWGGEHSRPGPAATLRSALSTSAAGFQGQQQLSLAWRTSSTQVFPQMHRPSPAFLSPFAFAQALKTLHNYVVKDPKSNKIHFLFGGNSYARTPEPPPLPLGQRVGVTASVSTASANSNGDGLIHFHYLAL